MYESEQDKRERERSDQILDGAMERIRKEEERKKGLLAEFLSLIVDVFLEMR
jgi:hypothetical protein